VAHALGVPNIHLMGWLASSLCCLGGIVGLANQKTSRFGNALGMTGVLGGIATTAMFMHYPPAVLLQCLGLLGSAGVVGLTIGKRVPITELPQTVAIFHSLVGLAAVLSCLSSFMVEAHPDNMHKIAS